MKKIEITLEDECLLKIHRENCNDISSSLHLVGNTLVTLMLAHDFTLDEVNFTLSVAKKEYMNAVQHPEDMLTSNSWSEVEEWVKNK